MTQRLTWKKFFESRLFFVIGIAALFLLSINLTRAQLRDRVIRQEITELQSEAESLESEKQNYKDLIALLETPEFMEKEARRALGVVRPGEKVVVIEKENEECGMKNKECKEGETEKISNPKKWWVYFWGE